MIKLKSKLASKFFDKSKSKKIKEIKVEIDEDI